MNTKQFFVKWYNGQMRKILVFFFLLFVVLLTILLIVTQKKEKLPEVVKQFAKPIPAVQSVVVSQTTLFVPYWTIDGNLEKVSYPTLIYFGISVSREGINKKEDGYKDIAIFTQHVPSVSKKLLTLRMIDKSINADILQDRTLQDKIIDETLQIVEENGFSGVILDLEQSAFAFDSVTQNITDFSLRFAEKAHAQHILYYQTLFGDTFYLARPYNVREIGNAADGVFVMSYDFHKANGTPGPNFPLEKEADADYSMKDMVNDFSKVIDRSKLTIIFGMFGYDWIEDEQKRAIGTAESLTTNQMQTKFGNCTLKNCKTVRNASLETNVMYVDSVGNKHDVWYEDMASVKKKKDVLGKLGIGQVGFWAYGYF